METFKSVHEGTVEYDATGKVTTGRNLDPEAQAPAINQEFKRFSF
jgi:hypothetical protein